MINIIKDKDPIWETDKYDVILVGTSIYNMLTNGFQAKIRLKYPYIDEANDSTNYGDLRKLGKRLTIQGTPIISLLYFAKYPHSKRVFVDYEALEKTLDTANAEFRGKKIMTTMLGCSKFDGNGDSDKVLEIMEKCLTGVDVDVYDYLQLEKRVEIDLYYKKLSALRKTDPDKFKQLWPIKEELIKQLYLER